MKPKPRTYLCRHCGKKFTRGYMAELCFDLDMKILSKDSNVEAKRNSLQELKEYFNTHYGYISLDLSDIDLMQWMEQQYIKQCSLIQKADLLSDHILANGLASEVQE